MKNFVKMTLATVVGLLIFGVAALIIMISMIGAIASMGEETPTVPAEAVLKIDMSNIILAEQSMEADPISTFQNQKSETIGIWNAIKAINTAAEDPSIKYIYMKPDGVMAGTSHIEELRTALNNFRKSGKAIISYIEYPSNGSYYLASVSDKIYMTSHEGGINTFIGVSSQMLFLKDILDKLGVNMQLIRHGKYKSAGEMYIRNSSSAENLEQNQAMIDSIWETIATEIASSRGISVEELNRMLDNLELNSPKDFLAKGLVDELVTDAQMKEKLCNLYMTDDIENVKTISLSNYAKAKNNTNLKAKHKVAVIYADGNIIDGKEKQQIAGDRFASIIADVRKDSSINAVVLRVNSPGGSVTASDKMKVELDELQKCKPVIASYSDYAASGGYWISNNCDKIYSNATTLTGSIGVFSLIPDFSGTLKNVAHVNITSVKSNKHSDMISGFRPLDAAETAYMQASVEGIYSQFTKIVSEGRDMTVEQVDEIAQGRVWTGAEALEISLVDQIGTIEDAINYAALSIDGVTSLDDVQIVEFPKPQTKIELLMEMVGSEDAKIFEGTALERVEEAFRDSKDLKSGKIYARMPYEIIIK